MNRSLLVLIASDPRTSHLPAEAIRLAAGLGASRQVQLHLYLHDAALLALGEETTHLVDEENYQRYLPLLARPEIPVYSNAGNIYAGGLGTPRLACRPLSAGGLAALARSCNCILRY